MKHILIELLVTVTSALPLCAAVDGTVKVDGGQVAGSVDRKSIAVFKGIPFAAPPVGDLRWRAPKPVIAWQGVKKADKFSAACVQEPSGPNGFGPWTAEFVTHNKVSEDCLYLNVWTPAKSATERLPVFVWIYGGGFVQGSADVAIYDGQGLASKGLVVVTFNYRLGILGFLAHPELTAESGHNASGDYGLLDQIAALKWVHENIQNFGGDPERVTIAGQSAGSMSVHYLTASPLAKGLFQRAIAESGGSRIEGPTGVGVIVAKNLQQAEADGLKFAAAKNANSLAALRAMTWQKLLEPAPGAAKDPAAMLRFSPIIDGYVAHESSFDAMIHGKLNDVPTLTGANTGEITGSLIGPLPAITVEQFHKQAMQGYAGVADQFLKLYPGETNEQAQAARSASTRDASLVSLYLWASERAKTEKTKTFIYLWDHTLPGPNAARYGAFHTSEVPYVMNTLYTSDRPFTDADRKIAEVMSSYWVNFAAHGDPNGKGLPDWPAVGDRPEVMEVGDKYAPVALAPEPAKVAFFETYLGR
jgi:para-nitrobenzyl esterase